MRRKTDNLINVVLFYFKYKINFALVANSFLPFVYNL